MSKMYGDWNRLFSTLNRIEKDLPKEMEEQLIDSSQDLVARIKERIHQQTGLAPLDEDTIRQKGHDTILIETGEMVDSIEATPVNDGFVISATGDRNQEILKYHEYGTDNMPSRPVIQPVYEEMKSKVQKDFAETLKDVLD